MEKLYSAQDIQRLLGFKVGRIRYWDKIGFLTPSVKIGARKYYTPQDLIGLRTAKGLLDAGLPFAKVKRAVIDVKKTSSTVRRPLPKLIIQGRGKGVFLNGGTVLFNTSGQPPIGFSQRDFDKRMKRTNMQFEPDLKPELEEDGTARKNPSGIRGSIKPKNP
jgi:DNA-binding transcriptional MerR regulator